MCVCVCVCVCVYEVTIRFVGKFIKKKFIRILYFKIQGAYKLSEDLVTP